MTKIITSTLVLSLAALASTACGSLTGNASTAHLVEQRHPITVDQQTVTLTIAVDPTLSELSSRDKARLRAFVDAYASRGPGPVTVTAPSGSGNADIVGQEVAADVRRELYGLGLDWSVIEGATYRVPAASEGLDVVVSYSNYVATPSACGDFGGDVSNRFLSRSTNNFGCATQNNLAAMLADPRDLVAQQDAAPTDASRRDDVLQKYREGQSTSSTADQQNAQNASDI